MQKTFAEKEALIKELFASCLTSEERYNKIIELGRSAPPMDPTHQTEQARVIGCQSLVFLRSSINEGRIYYQASSEALISAGLAQLLVFVYSGETPETVLKTAPEYLTAIGIEGALTLNRANGLHSIHLRMKQEALGHIINA